MYKPLLACVVGFGLLGCASNVHKELAAIERDGPGIWHMNVRSVHGDSAGETRMKWQGRPALAPDEQLVTTFSADRIFFDNPFTTHISLAAKAKKSLGLEEGDYVEVKNGYALLNAKGIPEITTVLCRNGDTACKSGITLGLKTKDGKTTTGGTILLLF